jgi:hypothetical protein
MKFPSEQPPAGGGFKGILPKKFDLIGFLPGVSLPKAERARPKEN